MVGEVKQALLFAGGLAVVCFAVAFVAARIIS